LSLANCRLDGHSVGIDIQASAKCIIDDLVAEGIAHAVVQCHAGVLDLTGSVIGTTHGWGWQEECVGIDARGGNLMLPGENRVYAHSHPS
jgi:hypothetical protein